MSVFMPFFGMQGKYIIFLGRKNYFLFLYAVYKEQSYYLITVIFVTIPSFPSGFDAITKYIPVGTFLP